MAERNIRTARALRKLLTEHGIEMSEAQISRIVRRMPSNLNMHLLAALCRALSVSPGDLILLPGHVPPQRPSSPTTAGEKNEPAPTSTPQTSAPERHPTQRPKATALPIPKFR